MRPAVEILRNRMSRLYWGTFMGEEVAQADLDEMARVLDGDLVAIESALLKELAREVER